MEPTYGYVQVAPQNNSQFSKKTVFLVAGLLGAVIFAAILLLSSGQKSVSTQAQHLVLRYDNLQSILSDTNTTRNIKNQDLSNLIASFSLSIITDLNDITEALGTQLPEKRDEKIIATEADTTTAKTIEDAYLENKLDSVYADVLTKKIDSLRALIAEIYGLSKDAKLKQTLERVDGNLLTTRQQIEKLSL